ncbi:MAG TPA: hypothetical protein VGL81_11695 [Polyangiaceae bacterium]|jgi:hypothetical protein
MTHPRLAPISRCSDEEGNRASRHRRKTITDTQNDGTGTATAIPAGTTVGKINIAQQRAKVEAQFTALVNGINTLVSTPTIACGDQTLPKAQVVSRLQARINAAEATKNARLALHAAVAAEALTVADTTPLVADLKGYFQGLYGKTSPKLQSLGFTPAKVPQKSAAAKAKGAAQAQATHAAVGPTGKKQRKAAAMAIKANAAVQAPAATPAPVAAPVTTAPVTNGGK